MKKNIKENKKVIPVFYAADENYLPYLAVAITSLKAHVSKEYEYRIHILCPGDLGENGKKIKKLETENISIRFENVANKMDRIQSFIHCRDYYTSAIYYRLFIPELFTQYKKAIYLDCDTVLLDDIANLYNVELGDNLIGAVADEAVASIDVFRDYTKNALGIPGNCYFNSGVIVMDLEKFRQINFCEKFCEVLSSYHFIVAPDQDCLNLICKGKIKYYDGEWNKMPIGGSAVKKPKLVHYNLTMKPWHYDDVLYQEYFWEYAEQTEFYDVIKAALAGFTAEMAERDRVGGERLLALAQAEADSPENYLNTVGRGAERTYKNENEVGRYGFIEDFSEPIGDFEADRRTRKSGAV